MNPSNRPTHFESAEDVIFDANLQEFAAKVGFICALENNDKISSADAYERIKQLWKQLKASKKGLNIGPEGKPDTRDGD